MKNTNTRIRVIITNFISRSSRSRNETIILNMAAALSIAALVAMFSGNLWLAALLSIFSLTTLDY